MTDTRDLFSQHNLRCTAQRLALYETLAERHDHPTAEELYRIAKSRTEKLSLATVYNTLDALCMVGLVRKLPTTNGSCRYDADTSIHPHIRYRDTDEIEDVPEKLGAKLLELVPDEMIEQIESELNIHVTGMNFQIIAQRH